MDLTGRHIVHQNLHPKIASQEKLFHPNSSLNWLQIDDPELGMDNVDIFMHEPVGMTISFSDKIRQNSWFD